MLAVHIVNDKWFAHVCGYVGQVWKYRRLRETAIPRVFAWSSPDTFAVVA